MKPLFIGGFKFFYIFGTVIVNLTIMFTGQ